MKRFIFLIFCLISLGSYSVTYNTMQGYNMYENTQLHNIPFNSTSSYVQSTNYNTVKSLNIDGTVSMDYTTYKSVYSPRHTEVNRGLGGLSDKDDPNMGMTPVGDPDIYVIVFLLVSYLICHYLKIRKFQMLLLNIQKQ